MNKFPLRHLLSVKQLDRNLINIILDTAQKLLNTNTQDLQGKLIANLFFEPSTRTRISFQIAEARLGAMSILPEMQSTSLLKGESLLDTIKTIEAMGVNAFVIRHHDNGVMSWIAEHLNENTHMINAGEGWLQHPTQALLDLFTIKQHKSNWENLSVAIIGDLLHSRVARSLVDALHIMGVTDIRLIAPKALHAEDDVCHKTRTFTDLASGLNNTDVVVCLRLQKERMSREHLINEGEFCRLYGITAQSIKHAKPNAIVMHPGPINREIEISSEIADSASSVILKQVKNGVAVRMAVLKLLLSV